METLSEYIEEKETEKIMNEGFAEVMNKLLGFGTMGALYTWIASLIIRGGSKSIRSIANTFKNKDPIFKKRVKESKELPGVKQQMIKSEERKNKYEEDLEDVYKAIAISDWKAANEAFHMLPKIKQDSIELKKAVIEAIVKKEGPIITAEPTPGSKTFQGIRKTIDLPTAKAMAIAFEKSLEKVEGN